VARNTVIVDEHPVTPGLLGLRTDDPPPQLPPDARTADLLIADLDVASTGGRGTVAAALLRAPTPPLPFTPERLQEVIGPFLK
jgi:hypothetical protein